MIKKELYFIATKHWITIAVSMVILIITSSLNTAPKLGVPEVAFLRDEIALSIEQQTEDQLKIKFVDNLHQGKELVRQALVDAFVFVEHEQIIILRNEQSIKSYYVRPIIQRIVSPSEIKLKYVQAEREEVTFDHLFFLFALVCFGLPPLLFKDDLGLLELILLSPIKNWKILFSKMIASALVFLLITLFYLYLIDSIRLNLLLGVFIIGLGYIALGTLLGIFIGNKYLEYLSYPLIFIVIIIPILSSPIAAILNNILRFFVDSERFLRADLIMMIAFITLITLLDVFLFELKVRRMKR